MNRTEVIETLVVRVAPEQQQQLRKKLEAKTTIELEQILHEVVLEDADEKLIEIQAARGFNRAFHEMEMEKLRAPQRQQQLEKDFETFADAARTLCSFGLTQANFNVTLQTLGPDFTVYAVQQMLLSNGAILSGPTQQEVDEWERQRIEAHNQKLLNASPVELKQIAKTEAEQRRAQAQQEEDQRQQQHRQALDAQVGFPPLPEKTQEGQSLDSAFFIRMSNTNLGQFKSYIRKYGSWQITNALRTRIQK